MCEQLLARRRSQAASEHLSVFSWLSQRITSALGVDVGFGRAFEVLSDGLGYVEPNWYSIGISPQQPNGGDVDRQVSGLEDRIKAKRQAQRSILAQYSTQRAIGGLLYESGLFLVTGVAAYFLHAGQWRPVRETALPLRSEDADADSHTAPARIAASLTTISNLVLWPSFFENEPGPYFSLVYLHTSLWQSVAGVWALHARCANLPHAPQVRDEPSVRRLVQSAVCCLEDVIGWANEHEGSHATRRRNMDLFYRATGRSKPVWTEDGVSGGATLPEDRAVYDIPPSELPAVDGSAIFRRALRLLATQSRVEQPTIPGSGRAIAVLQCLEGVFVAWRLGQLTPSENDPGEGLPPVATLTLDYVRTRLQLVLGVDVSGPMFIADAATWRLLGLVVAELRDDPWQEWLAVGLRVLCLAGCGGREVQTRADDEVDALRLVEHLAA